jgi:DNA helicase II / ATP-dependent DNA helicase PcrA
MDSKITPLDELKHCIKIGRNFVLQGGAGSGKTETLKQLIEFISENYPDKKIACITHTNLAVDEIKSRVGDHYTISTIHAFLNSLTKNYKKNIHKIIFEIFKLKKIERKGIENYGDEKQQKIVEHDNYKKIYKKYADKLFTVTGETVNKVEGKRVYDKDPENFNSILNEKIDILNKKISNEIKLKDYNKINYNETKFDDLAELTYGHDGLLKISSLLFNEYKLLGRILQNKYDFIFIDEYQDTNEKIVDIFLKQLPYNRKTTIGLFGDSMQAIYEDGVGDVEKYIDEGYIVKVKKEDNYRCSEQVIKFINQLRSDNLEQNVALKIDENGTKELISDRTGFVKLYYSIYENKPHARSSKEEKENYTTALNMVIKEATKDIVNFKILMLTNKSISSKAGFETLYNVFAERFGDPKELIDKILKQLQFEDLFELYKAYDSKNYNSIIQNLKKTGFFIKNVDDKKKVKEYFNKIIYTDYSAIDTLKIAFELGLLKKSEQHSEFFNRKDVFLKQLDENEKYKIIRSLYINGKNKYSEIKKELEIDEDTFAEFRNDYKKEKFYIDLFSNKITFDEISNYYNYINEETEYITMHKTKGSGIDNVVVVLDEYNWSEYNFKSIFDSTETDIQKKLKNQKLVYVACSRAKTNLICIKLISSEEEEEQIKKFFKDTIKIDLVQEELPKVLEAIKV